MNSQQPSTCWARLWKWAITAPLHYICSCCSSKNNRTAHLRFEHSDSPQRRSQRCLRSVRRVLRQLIDEGWVCWVVKSGPVLGDWPQECREGPGNMLTCGVGSTSLLGRGTLPINKPHWVINYLHQGGWAIVTVGLLAPFVKCTEQICMKI